MILKYVRHKIIQYAWCLLHKKWSELVFLSTYILYCTLTVQHSEHCTVLKSRTFSVVNAWVLCGHCDRLRNFLTPGAKWLVQHSIPSPNQQRQPLPSLLSDLIWFLIFACHVCLTPPVVLHVVYSYIQYNVLCDLGNREAFKATFCCWGKGETERSRMPTWATQTSTTTLISTHSEVTDILIHHHTHLHTLRGNSID